MHNRTKSGTWSGAEGQTVFVDHKVEVRRGSLVVRVLDYPQLEHIVHRHIAQSGAGRVSIRIPENRPLQDRRRSLDPLEHRGEGFDLTYPVTWGAHW